MNLLENAVMYIAIVHRYVPGSFGLTVLCL